MCLLFGGNHVDIVSDEELPDASHGSAPTGNEITRSVIRTPLFLCQLEDEAKFRKNEESIGLLITEEVWC